jgi:uncharacterized membrane protein
LAGSEDGNGDQPRKSNENVPRPRVQTLSDMIFGLALSIGALSLISEKPADFLDLVNSLAGFGFAFAILAVIWVRFTKVVSVLRIETGWMLRVNLLMLFFVSVEPYLFNLLTTPGQLDSGVASSVYAVDIGSIFLILAFFANELTREEKKLIPKELLREYRLERNSRIITALLFYVSVLPIFWSLAVFGIELRYILWLGGLATWVAKRGVEHSVPGSVHDQTKLQD